VSDPKTREELTKDTEVPPDKVSPPPPDETASDAVVEDGAEVEDDE